MTVELTTQVRNDAQKVNLSLQYHRAHLSWSERRPLPATINEKWGSTLEWAENFSVNARRISLGRQEALRIDIIGAAGEDSYSATEISLIYLLDREKHLIFSGLTGESVMEPGEEERSCSKSVRSRFQLLNPRTLLQEISSGCGANPRVRSLRHPIQ